MSTDSDITITFDDIEELRTDDVAYTSSHLEATGKAQQRLNTTVNLLHTTQKGQKLLSAATELRKSLSGVTEFEICDYPSAIKAVGCAILDHLQWTDADGDFTVSEIVNRDPVLKAAYRRIPQAIENAFEYFVDDGCLLPTCEYLTYCSDIAFADFKDALADYKDANQ